MCPIDIDAEGCLIGYPDDTPDNLPASMRFVGCFFATTDDRGTNQPYIITAIPDGHDYFLATSLVTMRQARRCIPLFIDPKTEDRFRDNARAMDFNDGMSFLRAQLILNGKSQSLFDALLTAYQTWRVERIARKAFMQNYRNNLKGTLAFAKLGPTPV